MMEEITKGQVEELKQSLEKIVTEDNKDLFDSIAGLISLPDEQFILVAPGVMQSYQQALNNPNDKISLVQSLNAYGEKAEDVIAVFAELEKEVDNLEISVQKRDFLKEMMVSIINAINDTEGIAKRMVSIPIELCHPDAKIPQYAHTSDSGMDVYALEDITVRPGETVLVPTGIKVALPVGYELQVRPKSGRALKTKFRVANAPGTIDQGYRDEIKIIIDNIEPPIKDIEYEYHVDGDNTYCVIKSILHGSEYHIGKGEKFAQLVLAEVPKVAFYRVDSVMNIGEDRGGGFGSTGIK